MNSEQDPSPSFSLQNGTVRVAHGSFTATFEADPYCSTSLRCTLHNVAGDQYRVLCIRAASYEDQTEAVQKLVKSFELDILFELYEGETVSPERLTADTTLLSQIASAVARGINQQNACITVENGAT